MAREKLFRTKPSALAALLVLSMSLTGGFGCKRSGAAPPPLAIEQIPAEVQKAFAGAGATEKDLVAKLNTELQSKDYPSAFRELQSITALQGLNRDQQSVLARAMLTLTSLLQSARTQGDQKSDAALKEYFMTR